jgi:hypothetical protein
MATDPSLEDTDGASDESGADPALARSPGPPRPPRPGKRSKGSGRIAIPLPQNRADVDPDPIDPLSISNAANDAAPSVDIDVAERDDAAFPILTPRASSSSPATNRPRSWPSQPVSSSGPWVAQATTSGTADESFSDPGDLDADRAPNAPVTPWHGVPALEPAPVDVTPAHQAPHYAGRDASDSEPEPTLVGKVPEDLLELSGAHEENTRAFTAPRELIELARRKRAELDFERSTDYERDAVARELQAVDTARAPAGASGHPSRESLSAPSVPIDSVLPVEADAAPPIKRTSSGEMEAAALPSRRADSFRVAPSGPEIEIDPGSTLSPSVERVMSVVAQAPNIASEPLPSGLRKPTSTLRWLLTIGLFVIVGVVITRWRDVVALFP